MMGSIKGIKKSFGSLKTNPKSPISSISDTLLKEFEDFCYKNGVGMIGYTKVPPEFIFQEKAIIYDNAIVLVMEMDKVKIDQAPHKDTLIEIHKTYRDLGIAANKLASFLRSYGFSAQSSHPLGGIALYPRLGKLANLGWEGRHGLLITPKFGPRVRIAAVFTSITNLPFAEENTHGWINDYCIKCGLCIRKCPKGAILHDPIQKEGGLITHIIWEKCFPYFLYQYGCTVCIKECLFNKQNYDQLKQTIA
jgi:epoxyqueuosine reductase QueG